jgi:hypothetical protein
MHKTGSTAKGSRHNGAAPRPAMGLERPGREASSFPSSVNQGFLDGRLQPPCLQREQPPNRGLVQTLGACVCIGAPSIAEGYCSPSQTIVTAKLESSNR